MLNRYDLIIDILYPDDVAMMHECSEGQYVKHSEATKEIEFLKEALMNLKSCNMKLTTSETLNSYVDSVLGECL